MKLTRPYLMMEESNGKRSFCGFHASLADAEAYAVKVRKQRKETFGGLIESAEQHGTKFGPFAVFHVEGEPVETFV